MRQLPQYPNRNVLVGSATADDAGVFRLDRDRALVQTTDFFTPIVDDPFAYGQIAAANALSDVFAMGGRPLTALNIMGMPTDLVTEKTIATILRGGLEKAREVGCAIIGGHTIRNPEPIYGLAVTGMVSPKKILTNAKARPGDHLVRSFLADLAQHPPDRFADEEILLVEHRVALGRQPLRGRPAQSRGRTPARVIATRRPTASLDGRLLAAASAWRQ